MAVVGALAIAPHIYHMVASPTSMASDLATPNRGLPSEAVAGAGGHIATLHSRDAEEGPARHGNKASAPSHRTASRSPLPSPAKAHRVTLTCSGSGGLLPENYETIVRFLMAHGYTGIAAAGIAGNIYRESTGNPESVGTGGGGLIGWTPLPPGFVTGNPAADLRTQLSELLTYNQQWSQYIPALNAATSATQAADIYMNDFERPGIPAASEREGAAAAVAAACHL